MRTTRKALLLIGASAILASAATLSFAADDHAAEIDASSELHGVADTHGEHGHDAHGADGHEVNVNPLSVDPDLAIVTAVVFLILLAVLWKFAWGPISDALAQRENAVAENIAEAQRQNEEAKRLLAEHEAQLTSAAAEVKQMIDDAKRDAETQKQSILAEAQAAAEAEKVRAIREIDTAKNAALQSLAEKSVDTAVGLAGKIVNRQLSPEDHSQLINDTLQNFPSEN